MKISLHKWSLARNQNVNTVYRLFNDRDNIEILDDKRSFKLVVIREDKFREMISDKKTITDKDEVIDLQRKIIKMLEVSLNEK